MQHRSRKAPFALLLLAALLGGNARITPQDPLPQRERATTAARTWILLLNGDADGLRVVRAAEKRLRYRAPRDARTPTSRVRMLDAAGDEVASAPLDLSKFCLDPAHRGQPPHVVGDTVEAHAITCTVKVPALANVDAIEIVTRDGGSARTLGRLAADDLRRMIDAQRREEDRR